MSITFVSAFFLQEDAKRDVDTYKRHFDTLVSSGIHLTLFLDDRLDWTFPNNCHVQRMCVNDLWAFEHIPNESKLPTYASRHDTHNYIRLMYSKPEFVKRAFELNIYNTEWFAWIDFGICHIFKNPHTYLLIQDIRPPQDSYMKTAGIWKTTVFTNTNVPNWRFAGGFFIIHCSKIDVFLHQSRHTIRLYLPNITWEVNIWAQMERDGFDFGWYSSDHDDTMISNSNISICNSLIK